MARGLARLAIASPDGAMTTESGKVSAFVWIDQTSADPQQSTKVANK
jgi:hypothetical protein